MSLGSVSGFGAPKGMLDYLAGVAVVETGAGVAGTTAWTGVGTAGVLTF